MAAGPQDSWLLKSRVQWIYVILRLAVLVELRLDRRMESLKGASVYCVNIASQGKNKTVHYSRP